VQRVSPRNGSSHPTSLRPSRACSKLRFASPKSDVQLFLNSWSLFLGGCCRGGELDRRGQRGRACSRITQAVGIPLDDPGHRAGGRDGQPSRHHRRRPSVGYQVRTWLGGRERGGRGHRPGPRRSSRPFNGTNPDPMFGVIVSGITSDGAIINVSTKLLPADIAGDSTFEDTVTLPHACNRPLCSWSVRCRTRFGFRDRMWGTTKGTESGLDLDGEGLSGGPSPLEIAGTQPLLSGHDEFRTCLKTIAQLQSGRAPTRSRTCGWSGPAIARLPSLRSPS
jgi:hypothetical protein